VTVVNRMVDARPCNVFVVFRRVRNSRTIIIIIIIIKYLKDCTCTGSFGDILADRQTDRQNTDKNSHSSRYSATTRQSQIADSAPNATTCKVTLSTRHFRVASYAGTLCANMLP